MSTADYTPKLPDEDAAPGTPIIAVIGATGAQGRPVIQHLGQDGKYKVRALTRDAKHPRAKALLALGAPGHVEVFEGSAMNEATVRRLFDGVHGAYVNLDGFAVGEKREVYWGIRIFELALAARVKHFVWGNLDYVQLKCDYDPDLRTGHYDGKGRVAHFMKSFPSPFNGVTTWSVLTSGPYLDMLNEFLAPIIAPDGTRIFAAPLGSDGCMPMIDLDDLGFYARYIFDHPHEFEGRDLEVASQHVSWPELAQTFTKVAGFNAVFVDVPEDDYLALFDKTTPAGYQDSIKHVQKGEDGPMTWHDNFRGWFRTFRAKLLQRDYPELDRIHPNRVNLEAWMRKTSYDGTRQRVLKNLEDAKTKPMRLNDLVKTLIGSAVKYVRGGVGDVGVDFIHAGLVKFIRSKHPELLKHPE